MDDNKPGNPWMKSLMIWAAVIFSLVLFGNLMGGATGAAGSNAITYSQFVEQVDQGQEIGRAHV